MQLKCTLNFYNNLWGDAGGYRSIWFVGKDKTFRSNWFLTNEEAFKFVDALDKSLFNVYHACSLFKEKRRRQTHFLKSRALWVDLDLKGTDCANYEELLKQFDVLKGTAFDISNCWVIFTGHGYHVYWIFKDYLNKEQWTVAANLLYQILKDKQIIVDPARTKDCASVLRVPYSYNIKNKEPVLVEIVREASLIANSSLKHSVKNNDPVTSKVKYSQEDFNLNSNLQQIVNIESDVNLVTEKCNVIKTFKETGFHGNEPLWYKSLAVVRLCVGGDGYAHTFSAKDVDYKEGETETKLDQLRSKDVGPTLCETFLDSGLCENCPYKDKIKSPIQLGAVFKPIANVLEELSDIKEKSRAEELISLAPKNSWTVCENGIFKIKDGIPVLVCAVPFFIIDLICEDFNDTTVITAILRYFILKRPHQFKLQLKCIADDKKLLGEFNSRRIFPINKKYLKEFLACYVTNLHHVSPQRAVISLGWQENNLFVYNSEGDAFDTSGNIVNCVLDRKVNGYASGFSAKGSIENWVKALSCLETDDKYLPHLFSVLCSIGCPLMPFTSTKGFLLSLQGKSGSGKTLAHKLALSIWGNPDLAGVLSTYDTNKALLGRMATVKNLPLRLDEATLLKPHQLSGLIFELVNGRGRSRATIDGSLSNTAANWQTVTLVTTNKPLLENDMSTISEAERCRILELSVELPDDIMNCGKAIGSIIEKNYGVVGKEIIYWIIKNKESSIVTLEKFYNKFQELVPSDKRFWVTCGAIALSGAFILSKLNLVNLDIKKIYNWFVQILKQQTFFNSQAITMARGFDSKEEFVHTLFDSLHGHIEIFNSRYDTVKTPEREIKARLVENRNEGDTLYVLTKIVRKFVEEYYVDSLESVMNGFEFEKSGVRRIGKHTMRCFCFKL